MLEDGFHGDVSKSVTMTLQIVRQVKKRKNSDTELLNFRSNGGPHVRDVYMNPAVMQIFNHQRKVLVTKQILAAQR